MFVNIIANATGTNNVNDWFTSVYKEETTDSEVMDYNLFLDDMSFDDFKKAFDGKVERAVNARELVMLLSR